MRPLTSPSVSPALSPTEHGRERRSSSSVNKLQRLLTLTNISRSPAIVSETGSRMWLIHPHSNHLFYWYLVLIIFAVYDAIAIPFRCGFWLEWPIQLTPTVTTLIGLDAVSDVLHLIDILVQVNTALVISGRLMVDHKEVARRYCRSVWFVLDIITCAPLDVIQIVYNQVLPWSRVAKVLRLCQVNRRVTTLEENRGGAVFHPLFVLLCCTALLAHYIACIKIRVSFVPDDPDYEQLLVRDELGRYLQCMFWSMGIVTGRDDTDPPQTFADTAFTICMMLVGIFWFTYIISSLQRYDAEYQTTYHLQARQGITDQFIYNSRIPEQTQSRIRSYYSYASSSPVLSLDYEQFLHKLPTALQNDLRVDLVSSFITDSEILIGAEAGLISFLVQCTQVVPTIPNEIICIEGRFGDDMFFIQDGEVEVLIGDKQSRIATLRPGEYFGEYTAFTADKKRTSTVKSLTYCTLFRLRHVDLLKGLSLYPSSAKTVKAIIADHRDRTKQQEQNFTDIDSMTSINSTLKGGTKLAKLIFHNDKVVEKEINWRTRFQKLFNRSISKQSTFYYYWFTILILASFYYTLVIPFRVVFVSDSLNPTFLFFDCIMATVYIVDVRVQTRLRYIDRGIEVTDIAVIQAQYRRSWLVLDVISSLPIDLILTSTAYESTSRLIRLLRLIHIQTIVLQSMQNNKHFSVISLCYLIFNFLVLSHFAACIYYSFTDFEGFGSDFTQWLPSEALQTASPFYQYLSAQYFSMTLLAGIGRHNAPGTDVDAILTILIMTIGVTVVSYLISKVGHLMFQIDEASATHKADVEFIRRAMDHRGVGKDITKRVDAYMEHLWSARSGINPTTALQNLPKQLRADVMMHFCANSITDFPHFKDLEINDIRELASELTLVDLPMDEWVVRQGQVGDSVYFVVSGSVDVIVEEHVEVEMSRSKLIRQPTMNGGKMLANVRGQSRREKTLSEGDYFGEESLMLATYSATIRTTTPCALLRLNNATIRRVLPITANLFQRSLESEPRDNTVKRSKKVLSLPIMEEIDE